MHLSRRMLQFLYVAAATHQTSLQRIAAFVRFVCQLHAAFLAYVAVHVEVLVHGDHADRFFCPFHWGDA